MTPRLWVWTEDFETRRALLKEQERNRFKLLSEPQMSEAMRSFYRGIPGGSPYADPLPQDFPAPALRMPDSALAPDYFTWGVWHFVSARLRQVLALPDWAASYVEARVESANLLAVQRHYALLHLRSFVDAIDLATSDCVWRNAISAKTGQPYVSVDELIKVRFKQGLTVPSVAFHDAKEQNQIFATDALASRTIEAKCSGVQFRHPLWIREAQGNVVIRTARGLGRVLWNTAGTQYELVPIDAHDADAGPIAPALRLEP